MAWVTISRPRSFRLSPTQSPNTVWLPTSFKAAELTMTKDREVDPPSSTLLALEGRGLLDMASLATAAPFLTLARRGNRHAVIRPPGLEPTTVRQSPYAVSCRRSAMMSTVGALDVTFGPPVLICQRSSRRSRASGLQQTFRSAWSDGAGVASWREKWCEEPGRGRMVITSGSPSPRQAQAMPAGSGVSYGDATPTPERMKLSQSRAPFRRPQSTPDRTVWLSGRHVSKRKDEDGRISR